MMITGMCAADVSAAEKKTVPDYQAYAANLDKSAYSGNDLGASYSKKATTFKVWSPNAASVRVNIFEHGSDNEGDAGSIMSRAMSLDKTTGVWSVTINGDLLNKYYTYSVTHGKTTKETADVYAKACGVNGQRSMVVDLSTTNPDGWENDKHVLVQNQTDASVWEISVADFSSSESSGVSEANRGKYIAFTEEGTTVNGVQGASSTCVDYLKKLGVKYVQIMPFYDFGSVDESKNIMDQYNWGYDPVNYNCPEGSYSTNPKKGEVRIKECKQMIQALHNAGIMDVVYNHTYTSDSWLQRTVPNYYYRMNNDGTFSNGSGCSNDTASEHLMFRKYMIDSVTYWASEYHIDGFRFDLMGLHDVTTMNSIRTALDNLYADGSGSQILMYGEAWDMATNCDEGTVLASQKNLKQLSDRIGAFDDTIRDAIKGSTGGTDGAFVQEGSRRANLKTGIAGQSDTTTGWANVPSQCVTYASCHDNLCLYDKLVGSVYGADGKYRKRYEDLVAMNKLSAAIVITSQGIPFSLGGEEFCRSKDGDENSYASSRKENMLDWENVDLYSDVIEYYRGLYKIRDAFAAFSDSTAAANSLTYLSDVPKGVMGYTINNTESGKWSQMCVIFNGSDSAQNVTAKGDWVVLADNKTAGLRNIKNVTNSVKVEAHSAVIMVDTKSYDSAGIMDDEGAVVIDYYDNKTEKLIKSQTLTGELGTSYDVTNLASTLNYDVKKTDGEIKGVFTDQVGHAKVYVEEYDGEISTVTIKFVDETNNTEIEDSFLVKNRKGEQYYTPDLPSIKNYKLVLDDLPTNGAGKLDSASKTVTYKYTRVTDDEDKTVCRVNAIYMDDSGKILDTKTITGVEGQAYSLSQNTYEEKDLVSVPEKANGTFKSGEINVVFSYSSNPDPLKQMLPFVYVGTGLIIALCAASVIYSSNKRKKRIMAELDIEED